MSGALASADQLGRLGQYVERLLHQIAREVRDGNIDADPCCHNEAAVNDSDEQMRKAATELAYALKRNGTGSVTFSDINGEPLNARHPFARILHQSGFTPVPQGMRLY